MSDEQRIVVHLARRFDVSPRRLFDVWTDPRKVRAWLTTPPIAIEIVDLVLRARTGRGYMLEIRSGDRTAAYAGEYVEVVAGQRLAFTWVDPAVSKETTLVTVSFQSIPSAWAATDLRIEHARVQPAEAPRTEARWGAALDALTLFLSRGPSAA